MQHWRAGRHPLPAWAAADLLAHLGTRLAAGYALAEELRRYIPEREAIEARQRQRRWGFCEVRERDGPGSVPRDGRRVARGSHPIDSRRHKAAIAPQRP